MKIKDKRTDNRHKEHDEHGLTETKKFPDRNDKTFWECSDSCGWAGWLYY